VTVDDGYLEVAVGGRAKCKLCNKRKETRKPNRYLPEQVS